MTVQHVAFARSYDADAPIRPDSAYESWHEQINSRAKEKPRFRFFRLESQMVKILGEAVEVGRMAQYFPDVGVLDVMVEFNADEPVLRSWLSSEMHSGNLRVGRESQGESVAGLMNRIYEEVTGRPLREGPTNPRRTMFGSVTFEVGHSRSGESEMVGEVGVGPGERLVAEPNRMIVTGADWSEESRMSYILIASLCARARHLAWRIIEKARDLASEADGSSPSSVTLKEALAVRRDAVLASIEMTGFGYLGTGDLVRVYDRIFHDAAVSPGVERAFEVSAEGLHQLSDGLFALANDKNGRTLSYSALLFTFASIVLGAVAIGDFFTLPYDTRTWVYVLWVSSVLLLVVASFLLWKGGRPPNRRARRGI